MNHKSLLLKLKLMQPKLKLKNYKRNKHNWHNNSKHYLRKKILKRCNCNSSCNKLKCQEVHRVPKFSNCKHNYRRNNRQWLKKSNRCNNKWLKFKLNRAFLQILWEVVTTMHKLRWHHR